MMSSTGECRYPETQLSCGLQQGLLGKPWACLSAGLQGRSCLRLGRQSSVPLGLQEGLPEEETWEVACDSSWTRYPPPPPLQSLQGDSAMLSRPRL